MNARVQDALVETWRLVERHQTKCPTNQQVFVIVRAMGLKFKNDEGKCLLVGFRAGHRGAKDGLIAGLDLRTDGPMKGQKRAKRGGPTCAGVVPIPNPIPLPEINFEELEADVAIYVAIAASKNTSGKITAPRVLALKAELHALMLTLPREQFASGLRCANSHNAANITYVRKCAKPSNVTPLFPVEEPIQDRGPKFREWPASFIDVFHDKITNKWTFSDEWVKAKGLSSNVAWG